MQEYGKPAIGQLKEYVKRVRGLLEGIPIPRTKPPREAEKPGLNHTSRVAERMAFEGAEVTYPLRQKYHELVRTILEEEWNSTVSIIEDHKYRRLPRLNGFRQEILDHTHPDDKYTNWLQQHNKMLTPTADLKKAIENLVNILEGITAEFKPGSGLEEDTGEPQQADEITQEQTKTTRASNEVPWNENDPAFYDKKDAIEEAHEMGQKHEIDKLQNLDYGRLKSILRRSDCTIKHMSRLAPPRGKVHKRDWRKYLKTQVEEKNRCEQVVENMLNDMA